MIMKPVDTLGNTARDVYLKFALDKEIVRAKETEQLLSDKEVKEMSVEIIDENLVLSLIANDGTVIDSKILPASGSGKYIVDIIFSSTNKTLTFVFSDGSEIVCDISDLIDFLIGKIDEEESRAKNAENIIAGNLSDEITRATGKESELETAISSEETRAKGVEQELSGDISAEETRATTAEQALGTRIDNLDLSEVGSDGNYIKLISQSNGQVSATKQVFDKSLSGADDTNAPTSKTVKDYVDAETTRATAAEESLGNRIDGLDLNEVGASGSYIKLVSQSDGQLSASAQALDTEITALSNDNNAPTSEAVKEYVDAETTRATEVEATKVNTADIVDNLTTDDATVPLSAKQGKVLNDAITDEAATARAAEVALSDRINGLDLATVGSDGGYIKTVGQVDGQLSAARQAFDTTLTGATNNNAPTSKTVKDYVDTETTRASGAEQAIGARIDGLDLTEVGQSGSYIDTVKQTDGQVAATKKAFDISLASADNTNAPTSKTVKDYVDAGDAVLVPKPINPVDGKAYVLTYTIANGFTWVAVDTVIVSN